MEHENGVRKIVLSQVNSVIIGGYLSSALARDHTANCLKFYSNV